MNQRDKEKYKDFSLQYVWIFLIIIIAVLLHYFDTNTIIKDYGPALAVLFFGLFLGIKFEAKIRNNIITKEKQKNFRHSIGPILVERLKYDLIEVLSILYKMKFLGLEGDIYKFVFLKGSDRYNIDSHEIGKEFKNIAIKLASPHIEEGGIENSLNIIDYNHAIRLYYDNIRLYLEDIQDNIAPLIFMHSENSEQINLFINFNGNMILIKEEVSKYDKEIDNDLPNSFSQLFDNFNEICQKIIYISDKNQGMISAVTPINLS